MYTFTIFNKPIHISLERAGEDYQVTIYGGERPHIGCIVLAEPYERKGQVHTTVSVLNRPGHKDDVIAVKYAKDLCEMLNRVVAVSCGIHYEHLTKDQIKLICEESFAVLDKIKEDIKNEQI